MASKSRTMPALRNRAVPTTSKLAASVPERLMGLEPRLSSAMTMSATLVRLAVLVFSARDGMVLARLSAVGAPLRVSFATKLETALPSLNPSSKGVPASCSSVRLAGTVAFRMVPLVLIQSGPLSLSSINVSLSRSRPKALRSRVTSTPLFRLMTTGVPLIWGPALTATFSPCSCWRTAAQSPVGATPSISSLSMPGS